MYSFFFVRDTENTAIFLSPVFVSFSKTTGSQTGLDLSNFSWGVKHSLIFLPLPSLSPPLRSRPPLLRLGGLGERFSGSGWSPAAKRYLVNFRLKISPLVATIFRSFSGNESSNWGAGWPSGSILPRKQTVWTSQWHGRRFASMWQPFLPLFFPSPYLPSS